MHRWRTMAALSMVTAALLSCSPARITEESQPENLSAFEAGSHCPLFVDSSPACR